MGFPVCEMSCLASTPFFQFFVLRFRIHGCCWFPLKSLLLHLQSEASCYSVNSEVCCCGAMLFSTSFMQSLSAKILFSVCLHLFCLLLPSFWRTLSGMYVPVLSSISSECLRPGSSKADPRHMKAKISETKYKQRCCP